MVITPNRFLLLLSPSAGVHFEAFMGPFLYFLRTFQYLYICLWCYCESHYTKLLFTSSSSLLVTIFWVFFGHFKDMFLHYLRTNHYFLIKVYRMFFVLIWQLLHYKVLGVLVGMLSPFRVLFRAVKNSQYFLMLFCIKLLGNTLMVTKKKNSWDSKCLVIFGPF